MVKRILSLLLVFCLVLSCGACGSKPANNTGAETKKVDPFDSGND